jgi:FdhD protein
MSGLHEPDVIAGAAGYRMVDASRAVGGVQPPEPQRESVAIEAPVALVFNGLSHAVMMATPRDLQELALGFAWSEGLIDTPADCYDIELIEHGPDAAGRSAWPAARYELQVEIAGRCFERLKLRRRTLAGRTGCGLCGTESLDQLDAPARLRPQPWVPGFPADLVWRAVGALPQWQPLNASTGATHAAAWADRHGELRAAFEDVGRHNALDKLLGHLARHAPQDIGEGFAVMSSRVSHELVHKCARTGVTMLAAVSGPTTLAIDSAQAAGLRLLAYCREGRVTQYVP